MNTKTMESPPDVARQERRADNRWLWKDARTAVVSTLALAVLVCGIYPLAVWAVAQGVFPRQANGSLIEKKGAVVGSSLLGQSFSGPAYFHPRPSAAGNGYDATASSGSNLGPTSKKFLDAVAERVAAYRTENDLPAATPVPADAVTASGSGLDPHISPENARLQANRVARARGKNWTGEKVTKLIEAHTEGRDLGLFGEPRVNVLELNLALDAADESD